MISAIEHIVNQICWARTRLGETMSQDDVNTLLRKRRPFLMEEAQAVFTALDLKNKILHHDLLNGEIDRQRGLFDGWDNTGR